MFPKMMTVFVFNIFCFVLLIKTLSFVYVCEQNVKVEKSESIASSDKLLKNVLQHSPKVSEEELEEGEIKIMEGAHEEEYKIAEKLHMCIKDYTQTCPRHWKKIEANGRVLCQAGSNYNGFCELFQYFDNFTENDKMNFESSCNVEWPCKSEVFGFCENGRDYMEPCPEGFILQKDHSCKADVTKYSGYCTSHNINFTHMTDEEKEKWSIACEAYWPCYVECKNHNLSNCPKNWVQDKYSFECIPTELYDGPCKNKKAFTYFTNSMKREFEEKCKTRFECIESPCDIDYDKNCPEKWTEGNRTCIAPPSFNLCDRKKVSIDVITTEEEKKQFEKDCSVQWPCKQKFCDMEWTLSCPEGWTQLEKLNNAENMNSAAITYSEKDIFFCQPPTFYKGKCDHMKLHKDSDEKIKRELASSCDAPWSCIDKKQSATKPEKVGIHESESGPITATGKVFRSSKYDIADEEFSSIHDIMQ